jgi:hypothetical protein
MAGKITAGTIQLGDSSTATQNFVVNTALDGSMKIARGNAGATSQDVLTISSGGVVGVPNGLVFSDATTQTTSATTSQFGVGQTWQSFTAGTQRVSGTTYYNTTSKPIMLHVVFGGGTGGGGYATVGGVQYIGNDGSNQGGTSVAVVIPPTMAYSATATIIGITNWFELR